ncbi:MAG TPA: hypothetical protein VLX92_16695 [Kofleriaceae bacterium]|nr:hypothetical protein [Kofleriaceae bacterium]
MRVALAVSAVAHGAAVAALAWWWAERPAEPPAAAPAPAAPAPIEVTLVPAEPAPMEVTLVPAEPGPGAAAPAPGPGRPRRGVAAVASRAPAPAEPAPAPAPPAPRSIRPTDAELEAIAGDPRAPKPPPAAPHDARLEAAPGGRSVIHDLVTTVSVDRDGTAHLHDAPDFEVHLVIPHTASQLRAIPGDIANGLRRWYADPYAQTHVGRAEDLPRIERAEAPGSATGVAAQPLQLIQPVAGGSFDLTSYAMRKLGVGDAYASRKRALLDQTFDERAARGSEFRAEQLARSAELMRQNLEALWASTPDPAARRAALFALWDECAEGDGPLGEAGERARAQVIGWIRAHLPAGSPEAYTARELAELAASRTSQQAFEPY